MPTQHTERDLQVIGWLCMVLAIGGLVRTIALLVGRPAPVSVISNADAQYVRTCAPVFGGGDDDGVGGSADTHPLENECARGRDQALGRALLPGLFAPLFAVGGASAFTVRYRRYPYAARMAVPFTR